MGICVHRDPRWWDLGLYVSSFRGAEVDLYGKYFHDSMVHMRMTSLRRSTSVVQRDGVSQNGNASSDASSSPKSPHTRPYLALRGLLHPWGNPGYFLMVLERVRAALHGALSQRSYLLGERPRLKGLHWKPAFFHFSVFFIVGILIGFTPFLTLDISKNFISKRHAFSFEGDPEAEIAKWKLGSVSKVTSISLHEKQPFPESRVENVKIEASDLDVVPEKLLIIVTPTYARPFQAYYLNRLAHTLRGTPPPLMWIVVELSVQSVHTAKILRETGIMYRHLVCNQNVTTMKDTGVHQRNVALSHIEKHHLDGIVFFADDNRMFSANLFHHMRQIRTFGTWPVALLTENKNKMSIEGPVCNGTQVIGWHTNQRSNISRRFHVNMSGFAFNSTILWDPKRRRLPTPEPVRLRDNLPDDFQATAFIEQLVEDESEMEGLPNGCSEIMAWNLHLESSELVYPSGWLMQNNLEIVSLLT